MVHSHIQQNRTTLTSWLIVFQRNQNHPNRSHVNGCTKQYISHQGTHPRLRVFGFFFGAFFLPFTVAYAGVFSFLGSMFSAPEVPVVEIPVNSQNVSLLSAALAMDPTVHSKDIPISTVSDTALYSESGPLGTIADIEENEGKGEIALYVVKKGDSLAGIAKMFDVTISTILWANDLKKNVPIKEGQTLVILPVTGVQHVVKKGDTVASIAAKYKADQREILDFNNLNEDVALVMGEVVIVPDGEVVQVIPKTPTSKKTNTKSQKSNSRVYVRYANEVVDGFFMKPVSGAVRSQGIHGWNGVDLAAPVGTPIVASAAGTVIIARESGYNGGYGEYVVIKHSNGTQTLYGHMSSVRTSVGASVDQGQVIGAVGNTGKSTGPHLHFEIRGAQNPF